MTNFLKSRRRRRKKEKEEDEEEEMYCTHKSTLKYIKTLSALMNLVILERC